MAVISGKLLTLVELMQRPRRLAVLVIVSVLFTELHAEHWQASQRRRRQCTIGGSCTASLNGAHFERRECGLQVLPLWCFQARTA